MAGELQPEDPRAAGPYRLLGRLGAGGMGQVFLGRSAGGRLVAIKVIRPDLAGAPGFRSRFAREVAAARTFPFKPGLARPFTFKFPDFPAVTGIRLAQVGP
jgi:serine/threonine protein kinase